MLEPVRTVLVHGLAGSSRWWRPVEQRLADLELDPVDLPRRARIDELESWLAERLEPRAALVGHSFGGLLAARVAARRPELVDRLVLIAPAGVSGRTLRGHVLPLARTLPRVPPRLAPILVHDALRAGPFGLWSASRIATRIDVRSLLGDIAAPTLLIWGEKDTLVPAVHGYPCTAALQNGRLALVSGAGHVPMVERPDEVSRLLREFLTAP
jgi:pimeloyl-ACP methyl ester carboxylesterase